MNTNTKILSKTLANQMPQHIKTIAYPNQVGIISGMQGWFEIY